MKIARQQLAAAGAGFAALLLVALVLWHSTQATTLAVGRTRLATDIAVGIGQLRVLTSEYLEYHHERPRLQWQLRHRSMVEQLRGADPGARLPALEQLGTGLIELQRVFEQLSDTRLRLAAEETELARQFELRLASELRETAQDLMSEAVRIAHSTADELAQQQRRTAWVLLLASAIGALVTVGNLLLIRRSILHPIEALRHDMALLAAGRPRVGGASAADDEIGELSRSFEAMVRHVDSARGALESQAQQLAEANRELESFSYSVAHDLRTPLRAIDGFSQRLAERHASAFDADGLRYLGRMREGAQRMGQMIDDLLRLSRVSRAELRGEEVDLAAIARRAIVELRAAEPERKVSVDIAALPSVNGDPRLLEQLLGNLLGNAWKFTGHSARPRIALRCEVDHGRNVFCVEDNGAGFDMAYADKLFTPFQRLHGINEFPGTGIGLVIVRRIVQRHGGEVWAESAVDNGARFFFTLGERASTP